MEKNKECPMCGSNEIGQGELSGYAAMMPINTFITTGSGIVAEICTHCGYILSMRVKKPQKFK